MKTDHLSVAVICKYPDVLVCLYSSFRSLQVYSPALCLIQEFAGDPDEHAVGEGRLETRLGELVEHLGDSKTVVLPEVIQQAQGMVLEDTHRQQL